MHELRRGMEARRPNVILVGLSGSGKTTIGRAAARSLKWPFIDFDTEIERREHASVQQIFTLHGELHYRLLEQMFTKELVTCSGTIMSAGGGWVTNSESVALLRSTGRIIYLRATPELLVARLASARVPRPLLQVADPLRALAQMYEARRHLYEQADLIIETEVFDRKELIDQVRSYALSL